MTDWIEHNGGPQPVGDDVWVEVAFPQHRGGLPMSFQAKSLDWTPPRPYRILNQHLIDAKQVEIDQLRNDLETWQSVFPHVMPDRLKSDQQLAEEEDVAAKIDAARLEGIRLGLEAAAKEVGAGRWRWTTREENLSWLEWSIRLQDVYKHCKILIRNLNPDIIAREAVLDRLAREAQADSMGYEND